MVPEERCRLIDTPLGQQPPHASAADDKVLVADGIDLFGAKPVAGAKAPEHRKRTGAIVSKQKIRAHPYLGDVQPLDEHGADKALRIPRRQLVRKAHDSYALHAGTAQGFELLRRGHQQRRRLVGPQDARRVRLEGHRCRRAATLAGAPPHAVDDLHVPAVQAVEIAQGHHRLVPAHCRVVGEIGRCHEDSTTSPS